MNPHAIRRTQYADARPFRAHAHDLPNKSIGPAVGRAKAYFENRRILHKTKEMSTGGLGQML
jgi:hypothetical protein